MHLSSRSVRRKDGNNVCLNFFKRCTQFFKCTISFNSENNCLLMLFSLSGVWLFVTPWTAARQASLSFISWSLLKLTSFKSVMPSNYLVFCHPLLFLPSVFASIRVFSNELALGIRWPKYWSFSFSISSSNEYPGLISFRFDWFDLLAVQGTLKSPLQHHSSKVKRKTLSNLP